MGFAEDDPHQLAPSVGTTQVGITISAVPSPANHNSRARTRYSPLKEFNFIANLSIPPSRHQDRLARSWTKPNTLATTKVVTDGKELDDLEGEHKNSTQESHSRIRNARQKPHHP